MLTYAYFHKQFVPISEAKLGVMTNFIHYGTAVFEGIRGNWNSEKQQMYIFRLKEHYERMLDGCRVLNIDLSHTIDELCQITVELVRRCNFKEGIYIRPIAYKSSEALGVRLHNLEADFLVFAFPWGPYLAEKVRCCVSSWRFPNNIPRAKITGLYVTNALAKTEAIESGFDEAVMLTPDGYVCEGSGENIFLVIDSKLVTPPNSDGILVGITRDTVKKLAKNELGIETEERHIDRIELYSAEECFLTGTAANVTPVIEIDRRQIGSGGIGTITKKLQQLYIDVIRGNNSKYGEWCVSVYTK